MTVALKSALIRIWNNRNQIVGVGFLVTENHLLTCAHVVSAALNRPCQEIPAEPVQLDFPFITPGVKLKAIVALWQPERRDGTGDIAGLELQIAGAGEYKIFSAFDGKSIPLDGSSRRAAVPPFRLYEILVIEPIR